MTLIGGLAGLAFIFVGLGIHYAYGQVRRPRAGVAHVAPEFLVRLFLNFTRVGTACLVLGAAIVAGAFLLGPGLPAAAGTPVPVALYYTAALGLLLAFLTCNVLHHRVRSLLESGNRNDATAERIARVHGNFTEYAPLGLLLLFALEGAGAPAALVHCGGAVFTLGRYLHAWGFTHNEGVSVARIIGIQGTLFALAYLVLACAYFLFHG